jgi:hypothetical protein
MKPAWGEPVEMVTHSLPFGDTMPALWDIAAKLAESDSAEPS